MFRPSAGICVLLILLTFGCGERRARPVNIERARATLDEVLNHWKNGGKIDDFRQRKPEVVVQESNWTNGAALKDFRILGDGRAEDANWFCDVELTLLRDSGSPTKKTVTYVVGTDPVLTVFRAIL